MANDVETDGIVNLASQGKVNAPDGVQSNFSSTPNLITEKTNNGIQDKKASVSVELQNSLSKNDETK